MKYSLKDQYKELLSEDKIKVVTHDDVTGGKTFTRIYDLDNPAQYDPVSTLTISPSKIYDIGSINSFIETSKAKASKVNFNRKSFHIHKTNNVIDIKKTLEKNIGNILHNVYFDVVENRLISSFFSDRLEEKSYFSIIDKLSDQNGIEKNDTDSFEQSLKSITKAIFGENKIEVSNIPDFQSITSFNIRIKLITLNVKTKNILQNIKRIMFSLARDRDISINDIKSIISNISSELKNRLGQKTNQKSTVNLNNLLSQNILGDIPEDEKITVITDYITRYYSIEDLYKITLLGITKKIGDKTLDIRSTKSNVEEAVNYLNGLSTDVKKIFAFSQNTANRTGPGELGIHLFLNTTNVCTGIEPDAIIRTDRGDVRCSIKEKSGARTGEKMSDKVRDNLRNFLMCFFKDKNHTTITEMLTNFHADFFVFLSEQIKGVNSSSTSNKYSNKYNDIESTFLTYDEIVENKEKIIRFYKELKINMLKEHDAEYVIVYDKETNKYQSIKLELSSSEEVILKNISGNRIEFSFKSTGGIEEKLEEFLDETSYNQSQQITSSTINAGFKNKTRSSNFIVEGGKAGHMMHPYENLHMKISDMKRMIEDFQNDFEISEKVDGANLFFTIDPQLGKILFSRNKSDMSHEETLEKFGPDHPAHVLFTDGANAIFNSVKNSLSKQDIQKVFGQSPEGGKTYINFEIMHPQKPNQIKYDMKYIVFHAIVDYDINGSVVESSPDDERLVHLLDQLQPSFNVANNDFSLGSNLKIKLNNLSQSDVDELLNELNSITSSLGLSDDMTIADAVKSEIRSLLDRENITELLPEDKIEMIYDFITNESTEVKGTAIKKGLDRELQKTLTSLGLTSKAKAYKIIKQIIQEFRPLFILLGIKLLHNVQSRYMSSDASNKNVDELRRLLDAAMEDYDNMMQSEDLSDAESKIFKSLTPHIANVRHHGVERVVSSPVEGGVFIGKDGNTYKVTGGFAPLNQILGTAMRSLDHMPTFKEEFVAQERGS